MHVPEAKELLASLLEATLKTAERALTGSDDIDNDDDDGDDDDDDDDDESEADSDSGEETQAQLSERYAAVATP